MHTFRFVSPFISPLVLSALSLSLSACYVVPLHQAPHPVVTSPTPQLPAQPPQPTRLAARLYPANAVATSMGAASGLVTSYASGRGEFSVVIGAETFSGEATRGNSYGAKGIASAIGTRGNSLRCEYTMNSGQFGSGRCVMSSGAEYDLHFGN